MGSAKGGGGQTQTATQSSLPPAYAINKIKYATGQARSQYDQNLQNTYYPGSTVADFSSQSNDALNQMQNLAQGSQPILDAAQNQAQMTLNGDYLNPASNPYLQAMIDQTGRDTIRNYKTAVLPQVGSQFTQGGRYGSQAFGNAQDSATNNLAQALANISTNINYSNYSAERQNQNAAMNNAGNLSAQQYLPSQMLAAVGSARDTMAQNQLSDKVAAYNYSRDNPTNSLNTFIQQLQGLTGKYGTNTTTQQTSGGGGGLLGGLSNIAGLASGASGLAGLFTNPALSADSAIFNAAGGGANGDLASLMASYGVM